MQSIDLPQQNLETSSTDQVAELDERHASEKFPTPRWFVFGILTITIILIILCRIAAPSILPFRFAKAETPTTVSQVTNPAVSTTVPAMNTIISTSSLIPPTSPLTLTVDTIATFQKLGTPAWVGKWVNKDSEFGIYQLNIQYDNGTASLEAWGNCTPEKCYWNGFGTYEFSDISITKALITWKFSFAITTLEIEVLRTGELKVIDVERYIDNPGRSDYRATQYLVKKDE